MMIRRRRSKAKAFCWVIFTDAEKRKLRERMGLDTPVVLTVNYGYLVFDSKYVLSTKANALSTPPEEYVRKDKTQRN